MTADGLEARPLLPTDAKHAYASLGFVAWGIEPCAVRLGDRCPDEVEMRREVGSGDEMS